MKVTASELRQNIYKLLDNVLTTGQPLEIERKGKKLRIVPSETGSRLARLPRRKCLKGDPEDIVSMDWSKDWNPVLALLWRNNRSPRLSSPPCATHGHGIRSTG
jgi:antitoxin (DNA-binding transcriptional repressor) of toxin-antitoxin stability system